MGEDLGTIKVTNNEQRYTFIPDGYGFTDAYVVMMLQTWKLPSNGKYYEKIQTLLQAFSEYKMPTSMKQLAGSIAMAPINAATASLSAIAESITSEESFIEQLKEVIDSATDIYNQVQNSEGGVQPKKEDQNDIKFFLPLPNNLSSLLSHNYETDNMDPMDLLKSSIGYMSAAAGVVPKISKNDNKKTKALKAVFNTAPMILSGAEKLAKLYQTQAKRQNAVIDTNPITVYKGTKLRNFSFPIHVIPYSEEHAKDIQKAILALKSVMTGTKTTGNMAIHQEICFTVIFKNISTDGYTEDTNNEIARLVGIDDSVFLNLTDINITYGADGALALYYDGMPKSITITLNFVERSPRYSLGQSVIDFIEKKETK